MSVKSDDHSYNCVFLGLPLNKTCDQFLFQEMHFIWYSTRNYLPHSLASSFLNTFASLSSFAWFLNVLVPDGLCPCHCFNVHIFSAHDLIHFFDHLLYMPVNQSISFSPVFSSAHDYHVQLSIWHFYTNYQSAFKFTMWKIECILPFILISNLEFFSHH